LIEIQNKNIPGGKKKNGKKNHRLKEKIRQKKIVAREIVALALRCLILQKCEDKISIPPAPRRQVRGIFSSISFFSFFIEKFLKQV